MRIAAKDIRKGDSVTLYGKQCQVWAAGHTWDAGFPRIPKHRKVALHTQLGYAVLNPSTQIHVHNRKEIS